MIIIKNKYLVRKGFVGITLWPFIILKYDALRENSVFINHEKIHLRQQLEMFVLLFYVWYIVEYIVRLFQYKNRHLAYHNISFEREAYANEKDLDYLKSRSLWAFFKYISLVVSN